MRLIEEIAARLKGLTGRPSEEPALPGPPTDGVVGIRPVSGVASLPNSRDGRFAQFSAMETGDFSARERPRRSKRKVPALTGRVMVASLFLNRDEKGWSDDEIVKAHAAILRAGEWIEREAIRLGASMHLDLADTYFVAEDPIHEEDVALAVMPEGSRDGLFEAEAEVKLVAAASRAAARMGFADVADLSEKIGRRVDTDILIWLIHPRSAGRSFVVSEAVSGMKGVNLAICYAREADFPGKIAGPPFSDPITFAHEMLHLFGATDKYQIPLLAFPKGTVTERDIMRLEFEVLSKLRVDPGTASEIGWQA